ncbi:RagB/SusD family nutrient uptake outer membrane protein [uncultured Bacteroides sp.]|uniref:RagB/SusD family nutrient uptake outer membrane protein n=1 Tax=uncultured Bacteroides sp. TaxID=162156 RepID=UPI002AAC09BC|nr:RagB/SusD family nutrient uptake outer membrane protein [uncultured Bacteroides sp.]
MRTTEFYKYTYKVLLVNFILLLSSCSNILDLEPEQSVSNASAVVDKKSAEAALAGAYDKLQSGNYYGSEFVAAIYLAGNDVTWTGSLNYYRAFNNHSYQSDNTTINTVWYAIYATLNAANQVIDKTSALSSQVLPDTDKNRIVGEAYFIRALSLFDLGRTWGNVPIITKGTITAHDFDGVKQSTQAEVYQQVITDLQTALSLLPEKTDRSRATKNTARALLARVYLYAENWDKAEEYSSLLIADTNDYQLVDYSSFFKNKQTKESIFELLYTTSDKNTHAAYWLASANGGRHEWAPSESLVALLGNSEIGGTRKALYSDLSTALNPKFYVGNLYWRTTGDDPAYILRISEQYLIRAEARAKKTTPDITGALNDLNAVRLRAQVKVLTGLSQSETILAIENERRVEFPFEPHRWFDLVRTKRAGTVLGVTDSDKWVYPIPYNDIQADSDLKQNPSY